VTTLYPDGPPDDDIDSINQWAADNELDPEMLFRRGSDGLQGEKGWRDAYHGTIDEAFAYVDEGGFAEFARFIWSEDDQRWFVYVEYKG
jgi:hypothetical protein